MTEVVIEQIIYLVKLVSAAICGGLIGYERQSRKKTAGTRTHIIIAVAAAEMMIISKYGFQDVLGEYIKLDPSRIAAGIVTAIGFIGSGIIIFRNNNVNGITTSAGIWATVGVGMAMGAGMYVLGIVSTAIVMTVELFLGRKGFLSKKGGEEKELKIGFRENPEKEVFQFIEQIILEEGCRIESVQLIEESVLYVMSAQIAISSKGNVVSLVGRLKGVGPMVQITIQ